MFQISERIWKSLFIIYVNKNLILRLLAVDYSNLIFPICSSEEEQESDHGSISESESEKSEKAAFSESEVS